MKQRGMTFIGMLLTMVAVIIVGIIVLRVVPVYLHYFELNRAIDSLKNIPATEISDDEMSNVTVLKSKLLNQLYIDGMEDIDEKAITIHSKRNNVYNVRVKYTAVQPLVSNVKLLFDFDTEKEVTIVPQ